MAPELPDHTPATALIIDHLSAGYGAAPIVKEVSLTARAGQVTVILGPNGAGKSTLLKAAMGLVARTSGRVSLVGRDVTRLSPEAIVVAGMSYTPQVDNVFPSLTVDENLRMGAYVRPHTLVERREEVLTLFPMLMDARHRRARTLSGGQRNMLALARALMLDPAVLLLDEPTAGLAPLVAREVWQRIRAVAGAGVAVVVVEQNVRSALENSDYAYILVSGRNRYESSSAEALQEEELGRMFLGA